MSHRLFQSLRSALNQIVVGQEALVEQLLIALLAGGHVILEGIPGTGKTLLVKAIAQLLQADFRRIQLTPDVLPADILGTTIFDINTSDFQLKKGPVFTEILLADEINRTPPKTQAALLEAMEEQQVTLDGETLALPDLFWVVATQNSLEFEGTYPLPEAQLDRFTFKLVVSYPDRKAEQQMLLNSLQSGAPTRRQAIARVEALATRDQILEARASLGAVEVSDAVLNYLLDLIQRTRQQADIALGASPRSAVTWLQVSKAHSWLAERTYVTPDDVKAIALPLLRHRLILQPEAQLDGVTVDQVILKILQQVAVPR
jgi:MoxR-like ATPase